MSLTLDHVFVITEPGASAAERLIDLGLEEGSANVHPGQGTANRRFFFAGFVLELLYVSDVDEARHGAGRDLNVLARHCDADASPFGLVVRVADPDTPPAFPNWRYFPDYFGGTLCFHVGENSTDLAEPLCICMPPALPRRSGPSTEPDNPDWRLTDVEIGVPTDAPSAVLQHFAAIDGVHVALGQAHRLTLRFNDGAAGRSEDLAPELPLLVRW